MLHLDSVFNSSEIFNRLPYFVPQKILPKAMFLLNLFNKYFSCTKYLLLSHKLSQKKRASYHSSY